MRFTNFNVEVECTPSRSALLTGRMPVRSGAWRAASPGLPGGLAPWEVTLAEMLSDAGYHSAIFGKWHIAIDNLWLLEPMMKQVYPFLFSVDKEGTILPGGDEPVEAAVEIPFQRQDEIEQSMPAVKRMMIRKKLEELNPFGGD